MPASGLLGGGSKKKKIIGKTEGHTPWGHLVHLEMHAAGRGLTHLALCGLLCLTAVQPALAAPTSNCQFMVSVQVVHDCQYQIRNQPQKPSVVHLVMSGCSGQPLIATRGFATRIKQNLPGRDTTRYLLRETVHMSATGSRYLEIDF